MNARRMLTVSRGLLLVTATLLLQACGGSDGSPPPDPAGMVSSGIRVSGQGAFQIDFDTGLVTSGAFSSTNDMMLDANVNFDAFNPRQIADVGVVGGLGSITAIPSAGFVAALQASTGHGYVLRDGAKYWRIYVSSNIISATSGGVIGVNIKWAPLPV